MFYGQASLRDAAALTRPFDRDPQTAQWHDPFVKRCRISIPNIFVRVVAGALLTTATQAQAAPASSDPGFEEVVTKTNLYVEALNGVSSVQRTYDRYASWVDVKKGFTGKERYISYGLYEISTATIDQVRRAADKGPLMKPPLPELDAIIVRLAEVVTALAPLVKKASDYYDQEDYKDDGAKLGQELHRQMMPLFERSFAAAAELRRGLETIKVELDQRQLAEIEKTNGRNYHWHLRSYMIAAKRVIGLLPQSPEAPPLSAETYKALFADLEVAYNALEAFSREHPDEVKKVMMASFVESAVKDFFAASKFLRRTLEATKLDRREYVERLGAVAKTYNDLIQRTNSIR